MVGEPAAVFLFLEKTVRVTVPSRTCQLATGWEEPEMETDQHQSADKSDPGLLMGHVPFNWFVKEGNRASTKAKFTI